MARLIDTTVELALGGSYFGHVVADAPIRVGDWRMDLVTDLEVTVGQLMVTNRGTRGYGPFPSEYKGLRLYTGNSGSTPIETRGTRQVLGAIPDGFPGLRFTPASAEWAQMMGASSDEGNLIHTLEWVGTFHAWPAGDVALVDQVSAAFGVKGYGLWLDSSGVVSGHMFSGAVVNTAPLALGTLYHLVLTREGSTGSQTWRLYVNGEEVDAASSLSPVVSATPVILVGSDHHSARTNYLNATVYHIGLYRSASLTSLTPLDEDQVAAHWAALQWTDVSEDILAEDGAEAVVVERGFRGDDPTDRVASPGECVVSLDNTKLNSGALDGYYSPGHVNCRAGFGRGVMIRVTMEGFRQFHGRVETISPQPGTRGMRFTRVRASDIFLAAADTRLVGVPLLEDVRSDLAFEAVTSRLQTLPIGVRIVEGRDTFPLVFDNGRDERVSVDGEWRRIQGSEFGRVYQRGDGTLVCEARGTRIQEHITAVLAIDPLTELDGIDVSDIAAMAVTRVEITTHAKTEGASPEVLAAAERPIYVEGTLLGGAPVTIVLPYRSLTGQSLNQRVGGKDMITPVSGTDWEAWHQVGPDGGPQAFEQTADTTVSAAFGPNSVELTLTNHHIFGTWFFGVQVRGTAIFDFRETVTPVQADAATIQRDGLRPLTLDMKYQDDPVVAAAVGRMILAAQVTPAATAVRLRPHVDVTSPDMLSLDISDRVAIEEPQTGIDGDYHIQGVRVAVGSKGAASLRWWLAPADPNPYWVLGVAGASELGETTGLYPA